MKMTELLRYDIPPEIIRLWQEQESEELLPLQEMAIKRHNLFEDKNLLLQAPTSSGKTFIGEMAAIRTALRRKKVVYLVPLKALAEEKYQDFQRKYAPYGIQVIVSTRDHRHFDAALEDGQFSIAVVVYEKLAQLLVRRPERLEEVELVVADELELLSDPDRGALVDLLLTRILRAGCHVIGLSAVVGQPEKLARWLKADLLFHERRPVELRYGVLHRGVFRYRTYNEYSEAEEELVDSHSDSPWETLTVNVCAFVERGESCLVFVKAKHESRRGAQLLAQRVKLPAATATIEALRRLEPSHSRDTLLETLNSGVAFHNADLSPEERRVVEDGFRKKEILAMVSTSTLAEGMNLPAQNVFLSTDKWQYDKRFGMPWKTPILRSEYENMGGRAGRYGSDVPFGRSILIAPTPFDQETLWRRYVEGEREEITPRLAHEALDDQVLRLVASRSCRTLDELKTFLESTLTGAWVWAESFTAQETEFRIRAAVNRVADAGMILQDGQGRLDATPFGHTVAAKGITIGTGQALAHWIRESETRLWSDMDLMLATALTPDGRMLQVSLTSREYEHADYVGTLKRLTQHEDIGADVPMNRIRNCNLMPFFEEVRAIKAALFLFEWTNQAPVYEIEERYHTLSGQILGAAEQVSWLMDAAAAVAAAFGAQERFVERIATLSERVKYGLREDLLPVARLNLPGLTRNAILALAKHGLSTPGSIANAPKNLLNQWLPATDAQALRKWAQEQLLEIAPHPAMPAAVAAPVLIVDDKHPGEICVNGNPVRLQEKQYRLIRCLAASPGECVPYDSIYESVWGDTVVEPNQMHFQKRKLLARIREAAPTCADLVTTIAKRGFVLDLTADQVLLRTGDSFEPAAK